jgi:hypothetical protein
MKKSSFLACLAILCAVIFIGADLKTMDAPRRLEILFLGHDSKHHDAEKLASILSKEYFKEGINISYTSKPDALNEKNLAFYDGLVLYANHDSITPSQEKALLGFVGDGKGLVAGVVKQYLVVGLEALSEQGSDVVDVSSSKHPLGRENSV